MDFTITRVYHEDQSTVLIDVTDNLGILHTLVFDAMSFYGLTFTEKVEEIKSAVKDKLTSEMNIQELVGETFSINNIYKKAFAEKE